MGTTDMKTLDELAIFHQTDRASVFTRTWGKPHNYAVHYSRLFEQLREQPVKLLEIGSASGEGVRMWLDYFRNGKIYGVDNVKDTCHWNVQGAKGDFTFVWGDQSDNTFWECFKVDYGADFDIIIDDGSHYNDHIITAFNKLWPIVKPGGFYAIEDLNVAYPPGTIFVRPGAPNHMDWLRGQIDRLNTTKEIDCIYFAKEIAVIRKAL